MKKVWGKGKAVIIKIMIKEFWNIKIRKLKLLELFSSKF